jgi:hypothetical protein
MQIPSELTDDKMTVYVGDTSKVTFILRGEASAKTVEFFVRSDKDYAKFNGLQNFSVSVPLSANYGVKNIDVNFTGKMDGTETVVYGYRYSSSSSGMIGMDQIVQQEFTLKVRCSGNDCGQTSPTSNPSPKTTSGGGGGGGTGGILPPMNSTLNGTIASVPSSSPIDPVISDVSAGEGGSVAQGVVDQDVNAAARNSPIERFVSATESLGDTAGKGLMFVILIMLIALMVVSGMMLKTAKGVEFS